MNSQQISYIICAVIFGIIGGICGWLIGKRTYGVNRRRLSSEGEGIELFVGNLPYELTEEKLKELFSKYGRVLSARIITNRYKGKSKGYGFVQMAEKNDAENAIRELNGYEISGRKIIVNEAKTRPR
jgi:RNA recognition motif-containing protein